MYKSLFVFVLSLLANVCFGADILKLQAPFSEHIHTYGVVNRDIQVFFDNKTDWIFGYYTRLNEAQSNYNITAEIKGYTLNSRRYWDDMQRAGKMAHYLTYVPSNVNYSSFTFNLKSTIPTTPKYYDAYCWTDWKTTEGNDFSTTDYKQTALPWGNEQYGFHPYKKIRNLGCNLCCCASILSDMGVSVNPSTLNLALRKEADGYAKGSGGHKVNINGIAVARVASRILNSATMVVKFKSNVQAKDLIFNNIDFMASVKNSGHWVRPVAFWNFDESDFYINDPMSVTNKYKDYSGTNSRNTRIYYYVPRPQKAVGTQVSSIPYYIPDITQQANYGLSSIAVFGANSSQSIKLFNSRGQLIAQSSSDDIYDGDTGELEPVGCSLYYVDAQNDTYSLEVNGQPHESCDITIFQYNFNGDLIKNDIIETQLNIQGRLDTSFEHESIVLFRNLGNIQNLDNGTKVLIEKSISTLQMDSGFYAQPIKYRTPSVYFKWQSKIPENMIINNIYGVIRTDQYTQQKYVEVWSIASTSIPSFDENIKIAFVRPDQLDTTFSIYSKTYGRVTSIDGNLYTIENSMFIDSSFDITGLNIGDFVITGGVYNKTDNVFYSNYLFLCF